MKRFLISAIALAGLGGCATYDYAGGSAPGGYYSGSPSYEYSYPDGYYGGYGGSYGYGLYGGFGGYGGYGYSPGYYGYSRPYYVIRPQPRPPHGDHDGHYDNGHRPPPMSGGGNRPPPGGPRPWRPGEGRPRPPMTGGEDGPRPNLPGRPRPPGGRPMPPRAEGDARPSRPMPTRPVEQSQSQPRPQSRPASPAVPRGSHFRNRPIGRER